MYLKSLFFATCLVLLLVDNMIAQQMYHLKGFVDRNYLLNLKVMEVTDSAYRFTTSVGHTFGYCGDIEGAVINLLQTTFQTKPHIRFLNQPKKKRYVYFHSSGFHMGGAPFESPPNNSMKDFLYKGFSQGNSDTTQSRYLGIQGREIVMEVLKREFNFDVKLVSDSLDVLELKVIDIYKLNHFKVRFEDIDKYENGCDISLPKDELNRKPNFCLKIILSIFTILLERHWDVYVEDKTKTKFQGYFLEFPTELFKSYEMLPQLDQYLREQYGLTLVKKKEYRTVVNIQFNE